MLGKVDGNAGKERKISDNSNQIGERRIQRKCLINLSTISSRSDKFEKGFDYQRAYVLLKDSIYNQTNQRLISEMEAKFDVERKENNLALQQLTIQRQHASLRSRNLVIAFLLLVALFLVGVFYWLFQRRRNKMIQKPEEKKLETQCLHELYAFKSRFFANISHEFRTPLTVILGMREEVKNQERDSLVKRNARHLLRLVNQLLDLSKLESGSLPIQYTRVELVSFLKYLIESFHSLAVQKDIELKFTSEVSTLETDIDPEKI